MTVNVASTKVQYNGNGTTGPFTYAFKILEDSDLLIIVKGTDGTESTLTLNTDYTVAGAGVDAGGTITLTSGALCATGETLTIMRNMDLLQDTDMVDGDAFSAESVEDALDKETMTMQQLDERCDRAVSFPKGGDAIGNEIDGTQFESRANKTLGFNALGQLALLPVSISAVTLASAYYVDVADYSGDLTALVAALGGTVADILIDSAAHTTGATNIGDNLNLIVTKKGSIDTTLGAVTGLKEARPEWFGAAATGLVDDYNAIMAAYNAIPSTGGDLILTGKYLFSSTLSFTKKIHIYGQVSGNVSGDTVTTTLIKASSLHGNGLELSGSNSIAEHFTMDGNSGNEGDGIAVLGNAVTLRKVSVFNQYSGAGIRIGSDTGTNANSWRIDDVTSGYNNRGVVISDKTGVTPPDANAGTSTGLRVIYNDEDGLVVKRAIRNTFVGTLAEGNGGIGIHFCPSVATSMGSIIVGGDSEGNTGGDVLFTVNAQHNMAILPASITVVDQAANNLIFTEDMGQPITWPTAPVISGLTSAGAGTYTTQFGGYSSSFRQIYFDINLVWTAHTGTGNAAISMPDIPLLLSTGITPLAVISTGISLPAGSQLVAYIDHATNKILLATSSAGVLTPLALPASGSIYISGHYYW